MQWQRFRLRTLMILVFVSSLALAAIDQLGRMGPGDFQRLREGAPLLVPFLIMIGLKLGLVLGARAQRRRSDQADEPDLRDQILP